MIETPEILSPALECQNINIEIKKEIEEVAQLDYEISVGHTIDEAYNKPHAIESMYIQLDYKGKCFSELRDEIIKRDLGVESLDLVSNYKLKKAYERNEYELEQLRAELLFDEEKMPWHKQRGCATALTTIAYAHKLIAYDDVEGNNGLYNTMGCNITIDSSFRFDSRDNSLANLDLRSAIINSRQRFNHEDLDEATKKANDLLYNFDDFLHARVTKDFKDIVVNCSDSLGIRSRKREVSAAILDHVDKIIEKDDKRSNLLLLSLGCGTAQSVLEVAAAIREKGLNPQIVLIDQDPISLACAKNTAEQMGLSDAIELHCESLFDVKKLSEILNGRKIDVAEDTGLREYLPDQVYINLTKSVWGLLAPDGIMTTGNMNEHRPQPEFLHELMGWRPNVIMRNISKGFSLHEKSGIPKGSTKARVTRDGVYTLFFSYK